MHLPSFASFSSCLFSSFFCFGCPKLRRMDALRERFRVTDGVHRFSYAFFCGSTGSCFATPEDDDLKMECS